MTTKQELSVEVAQINGVKINLKQKRKVRDYESVLSRDARVYCSRVYTYNFDVRESRQDEVLEKLTSNSSCSNDKDFGFMNFFKQFWAP